MLGGVGAHSVYLHPVDHWTNLEDAVCLYHLPSEPPSSQLQLYLLSYMYLKNCFGRFSEPSLIFAYACNPVNKFGQFLSQTDWHHFSLPSIRQHE